MTPPAGQNEAPPPPTPQSDQSIADAQALANPVIEPSEPPFSGYGPVDLQDIRPTIQENVIPNEAPIPEAPPIPAAHSASSSESLIPAAPPIPVAPPIPGASLTSKGLASSSAQGQPMSPIQLGPKEGGIQSESPIEPINSAPPPETSKQDFTFQKPEGFNALLASIQKKPTLKEVSEDIKRDFSTPKLPDDGELRAPTTSDDPINTALLSGLAKRREATKGENTGNDLVDRMRNGQLGGSPINAPSSPTPGSVVKKFSPPRSRS